MDNAMEIFRILGICMIATLLSLLIKKQRPEFAMLIPITAAAAVIAVVAPYFSSIIYQFRDIAESSGVDIQYMEIVIKIVGVAYLEQFASEMCRDCGENAIASKIEFGAKIIIVAMSLPIVYRLLSLIRQVIYFS